MLLRWKRKYMTYCYNPTNSSSIVKQCLLAFEICWSYLMMSAEMAHHHQKNMWEDVKRSHWSRREHGRHGGEKQKLISEEKLHSVHFMNSWCRNERMCGIHDAGGSHNKRWNIYNSHYCLVTQLMLKFKVISLSCLCLCGEMNKIRCICVLSINNHTISPSTKAGWQNLGKMLWLPTFFWPFLPLLLTGATFLSIESIEHSVCCLLI